MAESGNAMAQYNLALLYHYGLGVEVDINRAVELYESAAEKGQPDAQVAIGDLFLEGLWGEPDRAEAAAWYSLAAEQGHAEAVRKLSELKAGKSSRAPPDARSDDASARPDQGVVQESAQRGDCPAFADKGFDIDVAIEVPQAPINRDYSSAQLTRATFHGADSRILGLMVPDLKIESGGHYEAVGQDDGFCFWVTGIGVKLYYRSIDIYVAKEYKPGSCNYRVILQHEQDHVTAAHRNLNRFAPTVRGALTSLLIPKASAPVKVASPKAAEAEFQRLYKKLLEPVYQEMLVALQKAQGQIDSPGEYRRVHKLCRKW